MARLKSSKLVVKSLFLKPQSACNYCIYGTFEEITYFLLNKKNEIKKLQKNISSELLASFGRQLTKPEDIKVKLHTAELN